MCVRETAVKKPPAAWICSAVGILSTGTGIYLKKEVPRKDRTAGTAMRGSEKRVIFIRNTGSRIFEEAYFIVRRGIGENGESTSTDDMVREAQRIVRDSGHMYPASGRRHRFRKSALSFLAGAASAGAVIGGGAALFALL